MRRLQSKETQLVIRVPMLPPNPNKSSRNWYVNHKTEQEYADSVHFYAVNARNIWEHHGHYWTTLPKATITVSFEIPHSRKGPLPDYGNLLMRMKKAVDRLTARPSGVGVYARIGTGLIADDSPKCLTWVMPSEGQQVIRGEEDATIIEIAEILR